MKNFILKKKPSNDHLFIVLKVSNIFQGMIQKQNYNVTLLMFLMETVVWWSLNDIESIL